MWFFDIPYRIGSYDEYSVTFDHWGVDRSNWNEKSEAATRRENEAKKLFHDFLERCKSQPPSAFPITEEIIPATCHLTGACWTTFRRYVKNQGCNIKRREANLAERLGDSRKAKMYVISVTLPVSTESLKENKKEKEAKAAIAAAKRKEQEEIKKQRAKDEAILRAKQQAAFEHAVKVSYYKLVGENAGVEGEIGAAPTCENVKPIQAGDVITYAEKVHCEKRSMIVGAINKKKRSLEEKVEAEMEAKKRRLLEGTETDLKLVKEKITQAFGVSQPAEN